MGFAPPPVVVTMGEPPPRLSAHQATESVGGVVAAIRSAIRSPGSPGHPIPFPLAWKTTYDPEVDVKAAAALMIAPVATRRLSSPSPLKPSPAPTPPRLLR